MEQKEHEEEVQEPIPKKKNLPRELDINSHNNYQTFVLKFENSLSPET